MRVLMCTVVTAVHLLSMSCTEAAMSALDVRTFSSVIKGGLVEPGEGGA